MNGWVLGVCALEAFRVSTSRTCFFKISRGVTKSILILNSLSWDWRWARRNVPPLVDKPEKHTAFNWTYVILNSEAFNVKHSGEVAVSKAHFWLEEGLISFQHYRKSSLEEELPWETQKCIFLTWVSCCLHNQQQRWANSSLQSPYKH